MMFQGPLPENRKLAGTTFVIFSYASSDIMIKFESEEFLRAELEMASNGNSRLAKDYLNI